MPSQRKVKAWSYLHTLDFSNAFNKASRPDTAVTLQRHRPELFRAHAWAYAQPNASVVSDRKDLYQISSSGFRQGDLLSPLLFSLSIRQNLEDLKQTLTTSPSFPTIPTPLVLCQLLLSPPPQRLQIHHHLLCRHPRQRNRDSRDGRRLDRVQATPLASED
jgi:hypothetical protein